MDKKLEEKILKDYSKILNSKEYKKFQKVLVDLASAQLMLDIIYGIKLDIKLIDQRTGKPYKD